MFCKKKLSDAECCSVGVTAEQWVGIGAVLHSPIPQYPAVTSRGCTQCQSAHGVAVGCGARSQPIGHDWRICKYLLLLWLTNQWKLLA